MQRDMKSVVYMERKTLFDLSSIQRSSLCIPREIVPITDLILDEPTCKVKIVQSFPFVACDKCEVGAKKSVESYYGIARDVRSALPKILASR